MALEPFTAVEDGLAILRTKNAVLKQCKVYHRKGTLYIPHAGGFVRIVPQRWDDYFSPVHPDLKVLEIEGEGISIDGKQLVFKP